METEIYAASDDTLKYETTAWLSRLNRKYDVCISVSAN